MLGVGRRFGWGIADQALSSLTNFALGILVARSVSTEAFGAYSIAFVAYLLAIGLARALSISPLAIRYSARSYPDWRRGTEAALGMSAVIGAVLGAAYVLFGFMFASGTLRGALIALGACLPGLIVQDGWRNAFFARAAGLHAFLNDLLWAAVLFAGMLLLLAADTQSVAQFVFVWGGAATIASLAGILQARLVPKPQLTRTWWREHRDLTQRYIGEFAAIQGAQQLSLYLIAGFGGLVVLGGLRAAGLLFGPLNIVILGLGLVAVPEGARLLVQSTHRLNRLTFAMSGALVLITFAWGLVVYLLPTGVGEALLGESWPDAERLIPAYTFFVIGTAAAAGPMAGLKTLAAARRSLSARLRVSVLIVVIPFIGLMIEGSAIGVAWGAAVAEIAAAAIWFFYYAKAVEEHVGQKPEGAVQTVGG